MVVSVLVGLVVDVVTVVLVVALLSLTSLLLVVEVQLVNMNADNRRSNAVLVAPTNPSW